jgi:hypothetical protein
VMKDIEDADYQSPGIIARASASGLTFETKRPMRVKNVDRVALTPSLPLSSSAARAGSPSSPVTTEHVGEGGRAEDGDHLKRSQRPDTQVIPHESTRGVWTVVWRISMSKHFKASHIRLYVV